MKQELADVKSVMSSNIERVLDRGEKLELLTDQTERLASQSFQFKKKAESVNKSRGFFSNFFGGASQPPSVPQPNAQPSQRASIVSEEADTSGESLDYYAFDSSIQNVNNNNNNFGMQQQQQYQQQQQPYQQQPYQQQGYYAPQSPSPRGPSRSTGASSGQLFVKTLTGWFLLLIISDYN